MGALFLLLSLGAAIGFTAVDPRDLGSWRTMGYAAGGAVGIPERARREDAAAVRARQLTPQHT